MNTQAKIKTKAKSSVNLRQKVLHLAVASCFSIVPSYALAQDTNYTVTHGSATYTVNGTTLTITTSNGAILKWPNFNILAGEKLRFDQPSALSAVLNRVDAGGGMSQILGTLSSNGKVFLINPAGVMIGAGAKIDTAGFVASSLNMTDSDFLNGKMRFNADTLSAGKVTNAGEITTPNGGFVYLIAPQVANSGVITTPSGEAILAAGHSVEMVDSADPSMRVKVSAQSQDVNLSQIVVSNGGNIFSVLNSGTVSANTAVVGQNGKIQFRSAGKLETTATSVVEAKGTSALDGGHFRGFADGSGSYKGSIDASGRNGGFVETSAAFLDIAGLTVHGNALSNSGHGGKWLLDPYNFTVGASEANSINDALNIGGVDVTIDTSLGSFSPGCCYGGPFNGTGGTASDGNITLLSTAHILKNASGNNNLYFYADGRIDIFGTIDDTVGNTLSVTMQSGMNRAASGIAGGVTFHAGSDLNIHNGLSINNHNGDLVFNAPITASSILMYAFGGGNISGNGLLTANSMQFYSYGGSVGTKANFLNVATPNLIIGYNGGEAGNVFVKDASTINNANIYATGNVGLKLASGLAYGANINIHTQNDALIESLGDLVLDYADITFYGGGTYGVEATGHDISMINSSSINAQYGGFVEVSANSLTMDYNSNIGSTYYGGDVLVKANTISLNHGSSIEADGYYGGSATVVAHDLTLNNSSHIDAHGYYGGSLVGIVAQNVSLSNGSGLTSDSQYSGDSNDIEINYVGDLHSLGGKAKDLAKFLTFAKNGSVNVGAGSEISADRVGIITGALNINAAGYGGSARISANDVADIIVAKDITLTGGSTAYSDAYLNAGDELFLTVGGHLNLNSGGAAGYGGAARIDVGSAKTLFMDFPVLKADGFAVDGVSNAFTSTVNTDSGIYVLNNPGVIGTNTFVRYAVLSEKNIKDIVKDLTKDQLKGDSNAATNLLQDKKTADAFFGDDKDDGKDGKKDKKDAPKQCS
ncbi:MAG: filamentous hemagglutinin N-terminal domain-containing protein [Methylophilaceae bacterium]